MMYMYMCDVYNLNSMYFPFTYEAFYLTDVFKTTVRNFVQVRLCKNYSNTGNRKRGVGSETKHFRYYMTGPREKL